MEVGLLLFGDLTQPSGGFLYDRYLSDALLRAGHRVQLISQPPGMDYATQRRYGRNAPEPVAAIRERSLDVLVADELNHASAGPALARLSRLRPRPTIVGLVHHLRVDEARWAPRTLADERRFLRACDAWLCNSTATLSRVRRVARAPRSSAVVHPGSGGIGYASGADGGVEPATAPSSATRPAAGSAVRVLTVGTVIPRKNIHGLISACVALNRRRPGSVELRVAGDLSVAPDYVRDLRRQLQRSPADGSIRLLGRLEPRQLQEEYRAAELFVLPSFHEGFGIVLLEALAHGLPVIATSRGGAVDIVRPERDGLLVDPRRRGALGRALGRMSADAAFRERCAREALRRAAMFADWERSMNGAVRFLETMAGRGG